MTEKHIEQIKQQLPNGEELERIYKSFEGPIRAISKDSKGREIRYTVVLNSDGSVTIEIF